MIKRQIAIWEELLHFISNGYTSVYKSERDHRKSVLFMFSYFVYRLFVYPLGLIVKKQRLDTGKLVSSKVWLIDGSINDRNAIAPLLATEKSVFALPQKDVVYRLIFIYKMIWVFPLIFFLIYKGRIIYFLRYYDVLGLYEESVRILKKYRPNKLIFACDHVPIQIALRIAANRLKITTYYFQHGAITKSFPPLNFTVSFLDGQDSFEKYNIIGINGQVELVGKLLFRNNAFEINKNDQVKTIGVAINRVNRIDDLLYLVHKIKSNFTNITIIIRNHPADKRKIKSEEDSYIVSNPETENVFDFLSKIDLLIATNSSIHLEAVILNVVSVYYRISKHKFLDSHGFVKNGLAEYASNIDELIALITKQTINKSNVIQRAAYYDEFINSNCDYEQILAKYGLQVNDEYSIKSK